MLDPEHPLRVTTDKWREKIRLGKKFKKDHFDKYAEEGMDFYTGYDPIKTWDKWMVNPENGGNIAEDSEAPDVTFKFMSAWVADLVSLYGPMLYHRNPTRTCTSRQLTEIPPELYEIFVPPVPPTGNPQIDQQLQQQRAQQVQQLQQQAAMKRQQDTVLKKSRARLMETYLNYTPVELDLKRHARQAIDEALIKGRGVLWCQTFQPYPDSPTMVGSFWDSIDNLVIDPDADEFESAEWIAQECEAPVWKLAKEYGLKEDYLLKKAGIKSSNQQADYNVDVEYGQSDYDKDYKPGTNDRMCYWKIYSRMGMGDRLSGLDKEQRNTLNAFGDNVYLVVAKGIDFPLNLPEKLLIEAGESEEAFDEAFERVQWPIPFWIDNQWPCTPLDFHFIPNNPWPLAHIRPGLPELKFTNWVMSFQADNARHTSRLFMGYLASLEEEVQQAIKNGGGLTPIKIGSMEGKSISDVLSFITPPKGVTADLQAVSEKSEDGFKKRTGLAEGMYAAQGGSRSATESQMKQEALNIRPDDMANRVEDWMSMVARKEALAAQWLLEPEDVALVLGEEGARLWEQLIMSADPGAMALEFDYRIEAGSARKPNKAQKIENMQTALQTMLPILQAYSQLSGDVGPMNALLTDWAKANDIDEFERYLLKPPDPQQSQKQQQMADEQHQMEKQKLQLEAMKIQSELQGKGMDAQAKQLDMVMRQQEMQFKQQEAEMDMALKQQEMAQDQQQHEQELMQDQQKHSQEMAQEQQKSQLQLSLEAMMGQNKMSLAERQGEQQLHMAEKQGQQKIQTMKQQARARPKTKTGA
jgi:hypothetical protein